MAKPRAKSKKIRQFILDHVTAHPADIGTLAARKFGISRQAITRHLQALIDEGLLTAEGHTRSKRFALKALIDETFTLVVSRDLQEDVVWRRRVSPLLKNVRPNVLDICHYGLTEMINNVVDHSRATNVVIGVQQYATYIEMRVGDDGVGIFRKIQTDLGLEDQRHALLELTKGKLTTDPERHTGEGIFFASRMFDVFSILSGHLFYSRFENDEWLVEAHEQETTGTLVRMKIGVNSKRTVKEVFDRFAAEHDDYGFTRTHVPVELARYEGETLLSRSQAKRLLARFERFREVFLDFRGVETIGQAFADEIFRVFQRQNPGTRIAYVNASPAVETVIRRVLASASVNDGGAHSAKNSQS